MHYMPASTPLFSLVGVLVIQTVISFALATDKKRCSRPYIGGLATLELSLLFLMLASTQRRLGLVMFYDMALLVSRIALGPWWLWMALEVSGFRFGRIGSKRFLFLVSLPVVAFSLVIFTNPLHHLYWARTWFEGTTFVVQNGAMRPYDIGYCHFLMTTGSVFFLVGIRRHYGNERKRLILLALGFAVVWIGDCLFRLSITLPFGVNPFGGSLVAGFLIVGVSAYRYGFPRMRAPLTEADVEAAAAEQRDEEQAGEQEDDGLGKLSDRQRDIVRMVEKGLTYRVIAERLGIAERTVKYHMGEILDKCNLETREQLIAWVAVRSVRQTRGSPPPEAGLQRARGRGASSSARTRAGAE